MAEIIKGYVHSLESFGLVDGPGVRFVVFLSGCQFRCRYCHNPETWKTGGEEWTASDLYHRIKRYRQYWKNNGGITVSGGEPLLQIRFVTELFRLAQKDGVHTAIDTAGQPFSMDSAYLAAFTELAAVTDLFILDLKLMDTAGHQELTGFGNENVLAMAKWLSDNGKHMWIRHVLVPGLTDDENDLMAMRSFIDSLQTVDRVEVLPYHTLGVAKWEKLGIPYSLKNVPTPTQEQIQKAKTILKAE
ncbi:MAG: pyruvate formate lyase-activating protein [Clostridia bacterium]|nr:pyruvate formate lyase-activating protein [Clostridia bacterium]